MIIRTGSEPKPEVSLSDEVKILKDELREARSLNRTLAEQLDHVRQKNVDLYNDREKYKDGLIAIRNRTTGERSFIGGCIHSLAKSALETDKCNVKKVMLNAQSSPTPSELEPTE